MLDFGILPPEINSARMYSGPGSGPMMAAAAAWDSLAGQHESFAVGYSAVLAELQSEGWSGSASVAMADAAAPYVAWATATTGQAEQAANQARAAAAAYEVAFAATVPPAAVTANRVQFATLVATNFFGQNTMAIAATDAAYAEMWAQDAAAMYGYAESAAPATALTSFEEPPRTTNAAGEAAQNAAVAHAVGTAAHSSLNVSHAMSVVPQQLQTLSTAGSPGSPTTPNASPLITAFDDFNTFTGPGGGFASATIRTAVLVGDFVTEVNLYGFQAGGSLPPDLPPAHTGAMTTGSGSAGVRGAVLASVGKAAPVGKLSVPQSWSAAASVTSPTASVTSPATEPVQLTGTDLRGLPAGQTPTTPLGPLSGMSTGRKSNAVFRMRDRRFRMPRPAVGG
jgi:PPE-repeat protein